MQPEKNILQFLKSLDSRSQQAADGDSTERSPSTKDPNHDPHLQKVWDLAGQYKGGTQFDSEAAWQRFKTQTNNTSKAKPDIRQLPPRSVFRWQRYAAAAVFLALVWWGWQRIGQNNGDWVEVIASANERNTFQLPDGSTVTLNHNSKVRFQNNESWRFNRQLELEGEAFFEVASDSLHRFLVKAGNAEVLVLGTAFNVRHYLTEAAVEVEVEKGVVELRDRRKPKDGIRIKAGQKSALAEGKKPALAPAPELNGQAWRTGRLKFASKPVKEAIKEIERYFEVKIDISQSEISNCILTSNFEKESINRVLRSFVKVYGVEIRATGSNSYVVIGGKCG